MPNNTKQEELRRYSHMIVNGDTPHDSMMFLQDYANLQVLQAIEKIKGTLLQVEDGGIIPEYRLDVEAFEAIEKEYRNE